MVGKYRDFFFEKENVVNFRVGISLLGWIDGDLRMCVIEIVWDVCLV